MDDKLRKAQRKWESEGTEDARIAFLHELLRTGYAYVFDYGKHKSIEDLAFELNLGEVLHDAGIYFKHPLIPNTYFYKFKSGYLGLTWDPPYNFGRGTPKLFWFLNMDGFVVDEENE